MIVGDLVRFRSIVKYAPGYPKYMNTTWKIIEDNTGYIYPEILLRDAKGTTFREATVNLKRATKAQQLEYMLDVMKN